jgi:hypothetical protein
LCKDTSLCCLRSDLDDLIVALVPSASLSIETVSSLELRLLTLLSLKQIDQSRNRFSDLFRTEIEYISAISGDWRMGRGNGTDLIIGLDLVRFSDGDVGSSSTKSLPSSKG